MSPLDHTRLSAEVRTARLQADADQRLLDQRLQQIEALRDENRRLAGKVYDLRAQVRQLETDKLRIMRDAAEVMLELVRSKPAADDVDVRFDRSEVAR